MDIHVRRRRLGEKQQMGNTTSPSAFTGK